MATYKDLITKATDTDSAVKADLDLQSETSTKLAADRDAATAATAALGKAVTDSNGFYDPLGDGTVKTYEPDGVGSYFSRVLKSSDTPIPDDAIPTPAPAPVPAPIDPNALPVEVPPPGVLPDDGTGALQPPPVTDPFNPNGV